MAPLTLLCRNVTTFTRTGELDEDAMGAFLQRFIDTRLGVYLASGGSGEGHALTNEELRRVYEIGVAECKGKIPVNANPPEQHTASRTREQTLIAIEAGVDMVNVYGPASWHGYKPTDRELEAYFDAVLTGIHHPIAIAPNPIIGYTPSPGIIARICDRHHQIRAVNLSGTGDAYFIELMDLVRPEVELYVQLPNSVTSLKLGAAGILGAEANILPKTFRRYIDLYAAGDFDELARVFADLRRFMQFTRPWHSAAPRWLKMAMKVMGLPGGDGGVRAPYLPPGEAELETFRIGLLALGLSEIREAAGS